MLGNRCSLVPAQTWTLIRASFLQTGTPVQNDLNEFYAMIDFANPGLLGPLSAFKRIFAEPIEFSQDRTARWVVTVTALCTWIDLFCITFIF